MVTQNRQAVGVQDPLKLAHHLEKLGGTAKLMDLIHAKQQEICQLSQQCESLTDDTLRYSQTRLKSVRLASVVSGGCWRFAYRMVRIILRYTLSDIKTIHAYPLCISSLQPLHTLNTMFASQPSQLGPQGRAAKKTLGASRHQMEGL